MARKEGVVSRFFFNPVKNTAVFCLRGDERVYHVTTPPHYADYDDFVMTLPGDEVTVEIDDDDLLETWFNGSYLMHRD